MNKKNFLILSCIGSCGFICFINDAYSGRGFSFRPFSFFGFEPGSTCAFIALLLMALVCLIVTFFSVIIINCQKSQLNDTPGWDIFEFGELWKRFKERKERKRYEYEKNLKYLYKDICDEALQKQKQYGLNMIQTQMYNQLCRGEFCFSDGLAGNFFHPKGLDSMEWVQKQLKPLIDAGDVEMQEITYHQSSDYYTEKLFYDSRYSPFVLVQFPCNYSTNHYLYIKQQLNLPDGWFKTGNYESENFKAKLLEYNSIGFYYKKRKIEEVYLYTALKKLYKYLEKEF